MTNYTITQIGTISNGFFECDNCGPSTHTRDGVILRVNQTRTVLCAFCEEQG